MNTLRALRNFLTSSKGRATSLSLVILIGIAGGASFYFFTPSSTGASRSDTQRSAHNEQELTLPCNSVSTHDISFVTMPKDKLHNIGVEAAPTQRSDWPQTLRATGRLELNESRVAHVNPLVNGVVREVPVELGMTVKQGDVLAYIDSRQVGEAKLQLVKTRLQLASAERKHQWFTEIHENTSALLDELEKGQTLEAIEEKFQDRPVGTYRASLVSALADLKRVEADYTRLRLLGKQAVVPGKEVIRARAEHEAAEATYRALLEQIRFDVHQQSMEAQQQFQAAEAAVAISRSQILILGYSDQDIDSMDPIAEASRISYYPVCAPIAGTVIAREAALAERVDEKSEMFHIADLSTIWLRVDIFEKDLNAVLGLEGKTVSFETNSFPGRRFDATIFSLGAIVDDDSRASRLLATVDNSENLLKPGMFVDVELTPRNEGNVLQVPASAIQRHDGSSFVFVSDGSDKFERRDVMVGRSTTHRVEIVEGLDEGELVVTKGGFALKSEMLSELMAEE